jgi:hypothetical protein
MSSIQIENKRDLVQQYITEEKIFYIDAFDLEHITKTVYGVSIEMTNSPNDTTHEYNVSSSVSEYEKETLRDAIANENLECDYYSSILNDLCQKKLIEPGKYLVRMAW